MSKTQTLTFAKTGSNWQSKVDVLSELASDMASYNYNIKPKSGSTSNFTFDIGAQVLTEVITWTNDNDFELYKSSITDHEEDCNTNLLSVGWTITENVTDG